MKDGGGRSRPCSCLVAAVGRYCSCRRRRLLWLPRLQGPGCSFMTKAMGVAARGGRKGTVRAPGVSYPWPDATPSHTAPGVLERAVGVHGMHRD